MRLRAGSNARFSVQAALRTICVILGAATVAAACAHAASAHLNLVGKRAPEFARTDFSGHPVDLADYRGKVVLLNFWATWCAPCQVEMPTFASWQRTYGPQGFQVIGISMDDSAPAARRLVDHLKIDYPIALGDPHLAERYGGVLGLPLTFLIDRKGIVRRRFEGEINSSIIERQLKLLLTAPH